MKKTYNNKYSKNHKFHKHHYDNNNDNDDNEIQFIFNSEDDNKNEKEIPDWMKPETQKIENINERFNEEIIDYADYITPKGESLEIRQNTFKLFTEIIKKYRPEWKVALFGSYGQNTATIFSDLDFLILNGNESPNKNDLKEMYNLMNILKKEGFCNDIKLVKAKVPILKTTCIRTNINVDISMNKQNGRHAVSVIRKILNRYKFMKPCIIFLKTLLKKFNLNESHSGGMSSFLLFHLLYFLFVHKLNIKNNGEKNEYDPNQKISIENIIDDINKDNDTSNININEINDTNNKEDNNNSISNNNKEDKEEGEKKEINIGNFILYFLKYYGNEFDYEKNGLSLNDDSFGIIFSKDERTDIVYNKAICVESIIEKRRDVGIGCYNYSKIVNLFKASYDKIKSEKQKNTFSILQTLGFPSIK
jgi:DNA polymerase sigma